MRRFFCFLFLFMVSLVVLSSSLEAGEKSASTQDVWKELIKCLESGKEERSQEAERLGVVLPSQMPSDVAPLPSDSVAESHVSTPRPKFQEWTKVEAAAEVERTSSVESAPSVVAPVLSEIPEVKTDIGTPVQVLEQPVSEAPVLKVNESDLPIEPVTTDRSFVSTEPGVSGRMSAPEVHPVSPVVSDREKALATAQALGVPEDRELGDFLAYFPASDSEPEAKVFPDPSASVVAADQPPVYVPQVRLGTVVEQPATPAAEPVGVPVAQPVEEAAPQAIIQPVAEPVIAPIAQPVSNSAAVPASEPPVAQDEPSASMPVAEPAPVVAAEPVPSPVSASITSAPPALSHHEAFKNLLDRMVSRREARASQAMKYGLVLPSEKNGATSVSSTAPVEAVPAPSVATPVHPTPVAEPQAVTDSGDSVSLSTGEALKMHLDRLVSRRELREREAMKFGLELPSKRGLAARAPINPTETVVTSSAQPVNSSGIFQPLTTAQPGK